MKLVGTWLVAGVLMCAGCTKHNPDVCCTTAEDCNSIGFSEQAPCADGLVCQGFSCVPPCNGQCAGDTPFCAEDGTSCIGCFNSTQCSATAPVCDAATRSCRGCAANSECDSDICDLDTNACVLGATILYVTETGSVIGDCSKESPCILADAIAVADLKQFTIVLAPGTYFPEPFDKRVPITIIGDQSTFDVTDWEIDPGVDLTIKGVSFIADEVHTDTLNIECGGNSTMPTRIKLIDVSANAGVSSASCEATFERSHFGFIEQSGGTVTIDRSSIATRVSVGVLPFELNAINSVLGKLSFATGATGAQTDVSFSTITGGVNAPANLSGIMLTNNIISSGGPADAVVCTSPCGLLLSNNLLSSQSTQIDGNFTGDPLFVNPASDFHIKTGSAATDKANVAGPAIDLDGAPRPAGIAADVGAYELPQ